MSNRFGALDTGDDEEEKTIDLKVKAPKKAGPTGAGKAAESSPLAGAPAKKDANNLPNTQDKPVPAPARGREFERQPGNGKVAGAEVKGGAGKFNAGSITGEINAALKGEAEAEETPAASPVADAEPAVPEVVTITLDEFEKQRAAKRSGAMFASTKEDTSALLNAFKGNKKVDRTDGLDEEFDYLVGKAVFSAKHTGKATGGSAEVDAAAVAALAEQASLLNFTAPPRSNAGPERSERGGFRGGRGGAEGGFRGGRGGAAGGERSPRSEGGERSPRSEGGARGGFRGGRGGAEGGFRGGRGGASPRGAPGGGHRGPSSVAAFAASDFPAL